MILNFTAELLRMYIDMRLHLDGKFEKQNILKHIFVLLASK